MLSSATTAVRHLLGASQSSARHVACPLSSLADSYYNDDQKELQRQVQKLIKTEINPHCQQWEDQHDFPAHEVFKKLGSAGLLGVNKPTEYGGLGLDYKWQSALIEAAGFIRSTGVAMAIGVQTDCATPALARFGSHELKRDYLTPAISGDHVSIKFMHRLNWEVLALGDQ